MMGWGWGGVEGVSAFVTGVLYVHHCLHHCRDTQMATTTQNQRQSQAAGGAVPTHTDTSDVAEETEPTDPHGRGPTHVHSYVQM